MMCRCFYIDPQTKQSIDIDYMPDGIPETIVRMNKRISELLTEDYNNIDNGIFEKVVHFGDVTHIMIHRIILETGNIYIGLQKSGRGLRYTGFYSRPKLTDEEGGGDDGGDGAVAPVPEITPERIIVEINNLKNNTENMVQILVQFFGKLHLFHTGYSAIFENIRGF